MDNKHYSRSNPPPVAKNSRFAAAAMMERDDRNHDEDTRSNSNNNNIIMTNSRWAGGSGSGSGRSPEPPIMMMNNQGPPPVANSRFAKAAEMAKQEGLERDERRGGGEGGFGRSSGGGDNNEQQQRGGFGGDRGGGFDRNDRGDRGGGFGGDRNDRGGFGGDRNDRGGFGGDRGGGFGGDRGGGFGGDRGGDRGPRNYNSSNNAPLTQNSRFASAAADDPDYVDRPERERRMQERDREGGPGGRSGFRNERFGGGRGGGGGGHDTPLPKGPRGSDSAPDAYDQQAGLDRVNALLKPKIKKEDKVVKPPTKMHEDNMLKIPSKALAKDEETLFPSKKKKDEQEPAKAEPVAAPEPSPAANVEIGNAEELLKEFSTGGKQGQELAVWTQDNKVGLPSVDKLVFELLMENERLNPNPECLWAEADKFGAALMTLVEDNLIAQMEVLWGIQTYCDKLGFPKLNDESICQAMFRSMYKFDLATTDAFFEWKEDESKEHMTGKTNAIIQTMDWFAWLEEDDEEEEGDEEY